MEKSTYDFLNMLTYVGLVFFTVLYNMFMKEVQIWILILISLVLFLIMTSLMLVNSMRLNTEVGINDVTINAFIFFLGTNSISILAILPV